MYDLLQHVSRPDSPTMAREQSRAPPRHSHGDPTSLAPHERLCSPSKCRATGHSSSAAISDNAAESGMIAINVFFVSIFLLLLIPGSARIIAFSNLVCKAVGFGELSKSSPLPAARCRQPAFTGFGNVFEMCYNDVVSQLTQGTPS